MLLKKPKEIQKSSHEEAKTIPILKESPKTGHEEPKIMPKENQRVSQGEAKTMWSPFVRPQEGENRAGMYPGPAGQTGQQNRNNPFAPKQTTTKSLFGFLDKGNT